MKQVWPHYSPTRTQNGWLDTPVSEAQLQQIYDLMKWGRPRLNCSPARIVFVKGGEAKENCWPAWVQATWKKYMQRASHRDYRYGHGVLREIAALFPHADARSWFVGNQALIDATAFRNSSLQGAYFMLAARALGLGCGPMSGFDGDKINAAFFSDTTVKVNFVCSIGYGDAAKVFGRSPRLSFDEACKIL
ncbi:MAG: malonic semialdehyde reductase [Rhodocyclaceae bacterium]|nr:malonic semialdehyde reductase [Rhodocyclaceae bacterium]